MAKRRKNKINVFHHYVWATWDRLPLLTEDIERDVYRYIQQVCRDDGAEVLAVNGMPDHIHLLVCMSPTVSMSELMQHVKGGSSRFISKTLKPDSWFAWQRHYAVFSVAIRDRAKAIAYIQNQKEHHATGNLIPELEQTYEETEGEDTEPEDGSE